MSKLRIVNPLIVPLKTFVEIGEPSVELAPDGIFLSIDIVVVAETFDRAVGLHEATHFWKGDGSLLAALDIDTNSALGNFSVFDLCLFGHVFYDAGMRLYKGEAQSIVG